MMIAVNHAPPQPFIVTPIKQNSISIPLKTESPRARIINIELRLGGRSPKGAKRKALIKSDMQRHKYSV